MTRYVRQALVGSFILSRTNSNERCADPSFRPRSCRKVLGFVQKLADCLEDYEVVSEHEHSNSVIAAHTKVGGCDGGEFIGSSSFLPRFKLIAQSRSSVSRLTSLTHDPPFFL